jgi:DNA-binding CsgD family transcriptional regulator
MLHTIGESLSNQSGDMFNFTLLRPESTGYYSEAEKRRFRYLFKHLKRGIDLQKKIYVNDNLHNSHDYLYQKLNLGVVALDALGKIFYMNTKAQKMINIDNIVSIKNNRLQFNDILSSDRFNSLLKDSLKNKTSHFFRHNTVSGAPYSFTLVAVTDHRPGFASMSHGATLYLSKIDTLSNIEESKLAHIWGLSASEARLASILLLGSDIRSAAQQAGISYETARSYAKSIYRKAEVSGLSELIAKTLSLPTLRL